jgi:two-component system phosphate regulon sensor histidine kinase PhoR
MGNLKIYRLIVIMSIVLSLLILVQMNIIRNAARIKEEQFSQVITRCLMHVAARLEEDETKRFILSERMNQQQYGVPMSPKSNNERGMVTRRQINFSINMVQGIDGQVHAEASFAEMDTVIAPSVHDPLLFKKLAEQNDWEQSRFFQSLENRDEFTRNLRYKFLLANRPIEKRINKEFLEALIQDEFTSYGIDLNYEYVVKSYNQGEEKIVFSSKNYKNNRKKEHKTPLFINDYGTQKPNYLKVYFPQSGMQFFKDTSFMVIPTLLLVVMIIGIFTYTIVIIFQQKKLSMVKNDFINNMTHELKTPISTISLASQMLRDPSVNNTPTAIERISGVIYEESKRLSMQVEKVLQQAVFNEGRLKMKFKDIDIKEIVNATVHNFEIRVHSANGSISLADNATASIISGDNVHITNVFFNLLDNAVKYSKENPIIEVAIENGKKEILVSVKDNGIGIAKEHHKQIFERFYRVPTGNVHDVKGFGLGLHYVFKIVEAHNGTINIESALNKGTKFTVTFPLKE